MKDCKRVRWKSPFGGFSCLQTQALKATPKACRRLAEGIKNLFSHPISTLKAILGKGKIAYPFFTSMKGKDIKLFLREIAFLVRRNC
jgi:hypothetical protein